MKNSFTQLWPRELHPRVANGLASANGHIAVGDVVFFMAGGAHRCGQRKLHLELKSYDGALVSCIESWERIPTPDFEPTAHRYRAVANAKPYSSIAILGALTYSVTAGIVTALVPTVLR